MHVESEHAGTLADYMNAHKITFRPVRLYAGEKLPDDVTKVRAALIMGGPMNVYEEEKFPFLKDEGIFIKKLIAANVPTLGVCLGSQLIAKALGAKVMKAKKPEIGWMDIALTNERRSDALFRTVSGTQLRVLQWHEDTFELPRGAVHLAASADVPNQAFSFNEFIYGLQFHIEVDEAILKNWFKNKPELPAILKEWESYRERLAALTVPIYRAFFAL